MLNVNDLISDNKLLIKFLALVLGGVGIWANHKFNLGFTPEEVKGAAALDAAFIIGLAMHKPNTPVPAAAPSAPSADPGAVQKGGG